ncbi:MAG TPA: adenylate/guanylate cyclase domain-containing protein [Candidatus Dormibacteraeota bacterium]|nr:adenylate/guanylate cyclase domain-containing protein [Candidatus Dormibacteraeota bacterium]
MFKLLSTTGEQAIDLQPGRVVVVGRAVTSDVPIYDPTISRRHAEVSLADGGVKVRDVGSSNGTFLNGARISEAVATENDVITFGKVAFRVKHVSAPALRPQVVPPVSAEFPGTKPGSPGTIVRQMPVNVSGGVPAIVTAAPSGASHLKVTAKSLEELREKKLELLLEISKELSKQQELDRLLDKIVEFTFQVMNVDRVSILLLEEGELVPRISRGRTAQSAASKHVPQSIARRVVEDRVAILSDNTAADERFKGKSILIQSVRSAMCTPLMGTDQEVLGILYVDNLTATHSFSDDDLKFLIAFGSLAAVALENSQRSERLRREALVLQNFQRYFAPNLAAQIVQQEGAVQLGGTKRPVIIFFSDIRGFTPLSETMGPDDIATLLTEYFTEMVDIVFEHAGTLDKFMGDAIMALWGAPIAHEDDADRAMACALAQLAALEKLNEKWKAQGRPELRIGIGINFGEVFAGNIGSDRRLEYTVIGDAVNTAKRLCDSAGPNEILLSEPFHQLLKKRPVLETLEPIQVKGKSKKVPVYRVKR